MLFFIFICSGKNSAAHDFLAFTMKRQHTRVLCLTAGTESGPSFQARQSGTELCTSLEANMCESKQFASCARLSCFITNKFPKTLISVYFSDGKKEDNFFSCHKAAGKQFDPIKCRRLSGVVRAMSRRL